MSGTKQDTDKVFEFQHAVNPDFLAVIGCTDTLWISYVAPIGDDKVEVIVTSKDNKEIDELAQRFGGK